jgi:hypothetical protein
MARAIGISQASISRVASGTQEPGRQFLVAVASTPGLSDTWLYTGQGEPFARPMREPAAAPGSASLPIAVKILPGRPVDHPLGLTGMRFPVALEFFGPHRYWLRWSTEITIIAEPRDRFEAGDLLLLETDPASWAEGPGLLRSRLCAFRLARRGGSQYVLARWGAEVELEGLTLAFEPATDNSALSTELRVSPSGRHMRPIDFLDDDDITEQQGGPAETRWTVTVSDVVAVAAMMVRMLDALQ